MKRKWFSVEQIVAILTSRKSGCRWPNLSAGGISEQTFCRWKNIRGWRSTKFVRSSSASLHANNDIYAWVGKLTGIARIVRTPSCLVTECLDQWNVRRPVGPIGRAGPRGGCHVGNWGEDVRRIAADALLFDNSGERSRPTPINPRGARPMQDYRFAA